MLKPSQNQKDAFFTATASSKKDAIFGAARKIFGLSYFVTALNEYFRNDYSRASYQGPLIDCWTKETAIYKWWKKISYLIYKYCFCNKLVSFTQPRILDMGTSKLHTYLQSKVIRVSYKPRPLCSFQISGAASGNVFPSKVKRLSDGAPESWQVKWSQL